jgi:Chlorophyllase enzyme
MVHRPTTCALAIAVFVLGAGISRLFAGDIPPVGKGAFEVGSTNMEVQEKPAAPMIDYLKGKVLPAGPVSIATILSHPDSAVVTQVEIPATRKIYGDNAGKTIPVGMYVLYPTSAENKREDYKFPYKDTGDNLFPHMQKAGEKPIFADKTARYPLIVYAHGYEDHGLWHLDHLKFLASHGYIVVSVFQADGRSNFMDNFSLRPLVLRKALDHILSHPDFGPAIDPNRIGLTGCSFGGYTILAVMGGKYLRSMDTEADPRIKAGFGLVPFSGSFLRWPFGKDWAGLKSVRVPYMAVYGEKDQNVPPETVLGSIAQVSGTASAVVLKGEQHLISNKAAIAVNTWEILFFNTWLKGDAQAGKLIYEGSSVQGEAENSKTYQRIVDKPPQS